MDLHRFRCLLLSLITFVSLVSTLILIYDTEKFPFYWEEKTCVIEADCPSSATCIEHLCHSFVPYHSTNQTSCHKSCWETLEIYERKYYLQRIGHRIFLEGFTKQQCSIAYKQIGSISTIETDLQADLTTIRRREELKNQWFYVYCDPKHIVNDFNNISQ